MATNDSAVEFLLKFVVDKGSQAQAEAALAALEKEGVKFNQKAGKAGGFANSKGQFISREDVKQALAMVDLIKSTNVELDTLAEQYKAVFPDRWAQGGEQVFTRQKQMTEEVLRTAQAEGTLAQAMEDVRFINEEFSKGVKEVLSEEEKAARLRQERLKPAAGKKPDRGAGMMAGMTGFSVMMTGMQLKAVGDSLLAPIQNYVKYAGNASKVSAEWLARQKEIEKSAIRMGQNMAEVVAPIEKIKAELIETISQSKALSTIVGVGGGLLSGAGSIAMTGGQILSSYGAIQSVKFLKEEAARNAAIKAAEKLEAVQTAAAAAQTANTAATGANTAAKGVEKTASLGAAAADTAEAQASAKAAASNLLAGKGLAAALLKNVVLPIGAVLAGAELAKPVAKMAGKAGFMGADASQEAMKLTELPKILGQSFAITVGEFTAMIQGAEKGREAVVALSRALGLLSDSAKDALPQAAVDAFIEFRKAEVNAEQQYGEERSNIVTEAAKERAGIEREYEKQRSDIVRDFARDQSQALEDFNDSQAKAMRNLAENDSDAEDDYYRRRKWVLINYNVDLQRMEEDHQRKMLEMRKEHNDRVSDLVDARDAMGLWREKRDYERERKKAEDEYSLRVSRKNEDLALRLQEMSEEFAATRARRLQEYAQERADAAAEFAKKQERAAEEQKQRLADLDAEHQEELKLNDAQQKEKLAALDKQHEKEMSKLRAAFNDQLRELDAALLGETQRKTAWYDYQTKILDAYIAAWKGKYESNLPDMGGTTAPKLATGGYASNGLYHLGEDDKTEYVMNNRLMTLSERLVGGNLTNSKLENLLLGGAGGGARSVNVKQEFTFNGLYDRQTEKRIVNVVETTTTRVLDRMMD